MAEEPQGKKMSVWEVVMSYMTPTVINAAAAVAVAVIGLVTAVVTKAAIKSWKKDQNEKDGTL